MLITNLEQFNSFVLQAPKLVVADVETKGTAARLDLLLGIALAFRPTGSSDIISGYVAVSQWDGTSKTLRKIASPELLEAVRKFLRSRELVGHNIEYDRAWIDLLGLKSAWAYDTMVMWHLLDKDQSPKNIGYGLKTAQVELLGHAAKGNTTINQAIKDRGGEPGADIYLAPLPILAEYACLDASSTHELLDHLLPTLHNYYGRNYTKFYRWIQAYNRLLQRSTNRGVQVNQDKLYEGYRSIIKQQDEARNAAIVICKNEIASLEQQREQVRIEAYTQPTALEKYLASDKLGEKFNIDSPKQRATLLYDRLGLECPEFTPTGQRKTDLGALQMLSHPVVEKLTTYAEFTALEKLMRGYVEGYETTNDGKIHFRYNIVGTRTGRLSGRKPQSLNMPFSSKEVMQSFEVPAGMVGVHADLKSVEPAFIAALSKDPTLLKVHRDGLGDVYLDFGLVAFPGNEELQAAYNPMVPASETVKSLFKKIRNVCKTVHLAVGYTGSHITVAKNLTKAGFPTSQSEAKVLVAAYWELFAAVKLFATKCKTLAKRDGHIINPYGRIVVVPRMFLKDSMNRLTQSTAHDTLVEWVKRINRRAQREIPGMVPFLPDTHDATDFITPLGTEEHAKRIYLEELAAISRELDLGITLSADVKTFTSLFGLKNNEE